MHLRNKYQNTYDRTIHTPNISMADTQSKIFIFVILNDVNYETIQKSNLDKIVDLYGTDFNAYRINEIFDSNSAYDINKYMILIVYIYTSLKKYLLHTPITCVCFIFFLFFFIFLFITPIIFVYIFFFPLFSPSSSPSLLLVLFIKLLPFFDSIVMYIYMHM